MGPSSPSKHLKREVRQTINSYNLTVIKQALFNNAITTLYLYKELLNDPTILDLAPYFRNNTSLMHFVEEGVAGSITEVGAIALRDSLAEHPRLVTLDLDSNKLGDGGAVAIAELLARNSIIGNVVLRDNSNIGKIGGIALADVLKNHTGMRYLDIVNNNLSTEGGLAFVDLIAANTPLIRLSMSENNVNYTALTNFPSALARNCHLEVLNLRYDGIKGNAATSNFFMGLTANNRLRDITLPNIDAYDANATFIKAVGDFLETNLAVTAIGLTLRYPNKLFLEQFAVELLRNRHVRSLDLYSSSGDRLNASQLAKIIRQDQFLKTLTMNPDDNKRLTNTEMLEIAEALRQNPVIQQFKIPMEPLNRTAAQALLNACLTKPELMYLIYGDNVSVVPGVEDFQAQIADCLSGHRDEFERAVKDIKSSNLTAFQQRLNAGNVTIDMARVASGSSNNGFSFLDEAARTGDLTRVETVLANKPDLIAYGRSACEFALSSNYSDIVRRLNQALHPSAPMESTRCYHPVEMDAACNVLFVAQDRRNNLNRTQTQMTSNITNRSSFFTSTSSLSFPTSTSRSLTNQTQPISEFVSSMTANTLWIPLVVSASILTACICLLALVGRSLYYKKQRTNKPNEVTLNETEVSLNATNNYQQIPNAPGGGEPLNEYGILVPTRDKAGEKSHYENSLPPVSTDPYAGFKFSTVGGLNREMDEQKATEQQAHHQTYDDVMVLAPNN